MRRALVTLLFHVLVVPAAWMVIVFVGALSWVEARHAGRLWGEFIREFLARFGLSTREAVSALHERLEEPKREAPKPEPACAKCFGDGWVETACDHCFGTGEALTKQRVREVVGSYTPPKCVLCRDRGFVACMRCAERDPDGIAPPDYDCVVCGGACTVRCSCLRADVFAGSGHG